LTQNCFYKKLNEHQFRIIKNIADARHQREIIHTIKNLHNIILEVIPRNKMKKAFAEQAKSQRVDGTVSWFDSSRVLFGTF
jgi:hypothetical protein